jgi:hypothetical protein
MKLGLHTIGDPNLDALRRARGPVAKVFDWDSPDAIREIGRIMPLIVYRHAYEVSPGREVKYDNETPDAFFARLPRKIFGLGLVFEGPNEPFVETVDHAKRLNAWYVRFAQLMHGAGERVAAFSFSTGNPKLELVPCLQEAAAACDYIALHEYYSLAAQDAMLGRYRDFIAWLGIVKPLIITECGFDNGGDPADGWQAKIRKAEYIDILRQYDRKLSADPYVVGATIFNIGGGKWGSFDVASMLPELEALSRETITPAPGPVPQPSKLTDAGLADLVRGFADPAVAMAVILAESGGNPQAKNSVTWDSTLGNNPATSVDRGLWQFNSHWHSEVSDACAYDPACATKEAFRVSKGGKDFSQWTAFKAGTYKKYLERAKQATGGAMPTEEIVHEQLKIAVRRATGAHWHAKEIEVTDSTNMDVNIYVNAFRNGAPAFGEPVKFWWPYWGLDGTVTQRLEDKNDVARTDFPMSGDSSYDPEHNQRGPYGVCMAGAASDEVIGIGLPLKRHIKVRVVFEWVEGASPVNPPSGDVAARMAALAARVDELEGAWQRLRKAVAEGE